MKILIIGNGFDLAHDLPTSYPDFLDFVKAWIAGNAGSYFDDEINEHVNTNNRLLLYFLEIYRNRCEAGKRGWIDFENEITLIVRALDEARKLVLEHRYGFDLAHGVPSSYTHFRDWLSVNDPRLKAEIEYIHIASADTLWWNFENSLGHINPDEILEKINQTMNDFNMPSKDTHRFNSSPK